MSITGTMRAIDETLGAVRVEDVYATDIHDLWEACTKPERLARWIATVSGEAGEGDTVEAVFTSTWSGTVRVESCDAPHHLLLVTDSEGDQSQIEAWLTSEGEGTRLVIEERGLPNRALHFYCAGWQAHLEDLGRALASGRAAHADGWSPERPAAEWHERWTELTPSYEQSVR